MVPRPISSSLACRSPRNRSPSWGSVSRPSMMQCRYTLSAPMALAMSSTPNQWSAWLCTPPVPTRPIRWMALPASMAAFMFLTSTGLVIMEPSRMLLVMRVSCWYTMRPAPMLVWPTSELPIWPSGRPTAMPEASMVVMGQVEKILSRLGLLAAATALPKVWSGVQPKPSMMQRTAGRLAIMFAPYQNSFINLWWRRPR